MSDIDKAKLGASEYEMNRQFDRYGRYRPFSDVQVLAGDQHWVESLFAYLLWFEFLAISPSYDLARRYKLRPKSLNGITLPKDFDRVQEVYDDLGNARTQLFKNWWGSVAEEQFGERADEPKVHLVGYTADGIQPDPDLTNELGYYFEEDWEWQGQQPTMIVAIPTGMEKRDITRGISQALKLVPADKKSRPSNARYSVRGRRLKAHAYVRDLWLTHYLAFNPDVELWEAGEISLKRATLGSPPRLEDQAMLDEVESIRDRENSTRRSLKRAWITAENAARGEFPKGDSCEHAIQLDHKSLKRRIEARQRLQDWKVEKRERQQADFRDLASGRTDLA